MVTGQGRRRRRGWAKSMAGEIKNWLSSPLSYVWDAHGLPANVRRPYRSSPSISLHLICLVVHAHTFVDSIFDLFGKFVVGEWWWWWYVYGDVCYVPCLPVHCTAHLLPLSFSFCTHALFAFHSLCLCCAHLFLFLCTSSLLFLHII